MTPFDTFMAHALYAPARGYYSGALPKLGTSAKDGSDFVTAPELSPYFGQCVAQQVAQALAATGTAEVWEFGAGSGALAAQVLQTLCELKVELKRYHIVDVSAHLRLRQQQRLAAFADVVQWHSAWPDELHGVVLGNEVLDAMPVKLLHRQAGVWHERFVNASGNAMDNSNLDCIFDANITLDWADEISALRPPVEVAGQHNYLTEIHPQAEAFVRSLCERHATGAAFFIDYGFNETEYYHPQRHMGTLMCHRLHQSDANPLIDVGQKDITAHVNFSGIALTAQDSGAAVLGYTSQARFLLNCGLLQGLENASMAERAMAQKLITEHEMGELFKVLGWAARGSTERLVDAIGFAQGDRTHTL